MNRKELRQQAWEVWITTYTEPTAWMKIDFECWYKGTHNGICVIAGSGGGRQRCIAPCTFCLSRSQ